MASLFVVDTEEYASFWKCAESDGEATVHHVGPYVEVRFVDGLTIDRAATGLRHALWYSAIAALDGARVVQFDKVRLRLVAADSQSSAS